MDGISLKFYVLIQSFRVVAALEPQSPTTQQGIAGQARNDGAKNRTTEYVCTILSVIKASVLLMSKAR